MIFSVVAEKQRTAKGVAMLVDKWIQRIERFTFIDKQIKNVTFRIHRGHIMVVISVYASDEGKREETMRSYEKLQQEIFKYKNQHLVMANELNIKVEYYPIRKYLERYRYSK